ncbi:MAG TPA: class I lanthipeptide [Chitinophaga sp.]|uniref:class I lanthipeptide n=1 Tax=Chitinophaga sp. TaxID=1869181 RepID=UPI002D12BC85|nr:class I lanthipeptide [Chitinophaga sp.]HVI46009.1 class I lanthipeptide [Chitinophaga sp.]
MKKQVPEQHSKLTLNKQRVVRLSAFEMSNIIAGEEELTTHLPATSRISIELELTGCLYTNAGTLDPQRSIW